MGIFSSKQIPKPKNNTNVENPPDLKTFIQHYEYIKNEKQIYDIDKVIAIVQNTNWDVSNHKQLNPSAPPLFM